MKSSLIKLAAAGVLLAFGSTAFAGEEMLEIETRFRAKLAKEKVKQSNRSRAESAKSDGSGNDDAQCGSQSIGNINTGGRPGSGPREVFIFAPNAVNIVGRGGCR